MFAVLGKLGWFFRLEWRRYALAIVLLVIAGLLEITPPWLVGVAVDEMKTGVLDGQRLLQLVLLFGGLTVAIYGITYIWMNRLFGGAFVVERLLRSRYLRHLLRMTPRFYERHRTGDLMARATNDLKAVSQTAGFGILTLIDSSVWLLTITLTMGSLISWKLTLAAMLPLPLLAIAIQRFGRIIHRRFTVAQDAFGELNDEVLEAIQGIRVVRAYVREREVEQEFHDRTEDVYQKNVALARMDALFEPTIKLLVGASYLIGIGYGAYLVFRSEITLGELVSFNVYLGMLIWPMFAIGELVNLMQRGNASLDRVNATLAEVPDVRDSDNALQMPKPGVIQFRNVSFRYPSATAFQLCDVTFALEAGQTLGVVGRTGSGKTTLFKQLLREYPVGQGEIAVSGQSLERISIHAVRGWIGYVPQEHVLFSKTVKENVAFGLDRAPTEAELNEALTTAHLMQDLTLLPEGLDTLVGEKGVALSGGQKQRVAIARAILADPDILMLDDALSAVDGRTEAEIIRQIRAARHGKTTLIAAHRLSTVMHADRILVLEDGRIAQQGTHAQLMERGGWYRTQFERQQARIELKESGVSG